MTSVAIKNFSQPDTFREIPGGQIKTLTTPAGSISLGTLQPGWRWSKDIQPVVGGDACQFEHFEYVLQGRLLIRSADGAEYTAGPGDAFYIAPGHDGWVIGDEPVVTIAWGPETEFGSTSS